MKFSLASFLLIINFIAGAQSLTNENLNHLYNPADEVDLEWNMVKQNGQMNIYYALTITGTGSSPEMYRMQWEERDSFSQRSGKVMRSDSLLLSPGSRKMGVFVVDLKNDPWMLLLTITKVTTSTTWSYPFMIEKNYPVNGLIKRGEQIVLKPYLELGEQYTVQGPSMASNLYVFRYRQSFSSAFPPFSKSTAGADPILLPDSSFTISNGSSLTFSQEGLYLIQSDTTAAEGFSFRVHTSTFPRYTRVQDLVDPLVFVSTQDEFIQLQQSNGDKVVFDKTIIGITRDRDRAKRFMKSYYTRVELANQYFTSYKEGWKTDQGMTFIIFGLPDEIRKTSQNEIWYYKDSRTKFVFIKKGSIYSPNYYTLMRDDRFTQLWYNTIDLWRKSRF
ncbi:MAG: GWxTD domain-containing protein [Cyclobacteriaceae bacterium]|jgi:GWxTD domain-containing protein|nr:GWxTD domain-containing protein [Cyclobacteriaceae bacterium]